MKKSQKIFAIIAALAMASAAQADITAWRTPGVAVTTQDGPATMYDIYLRSDSDAMANWAAAFDGAITGNLYQIGFRASSTLYLDTPTLADMEGIAYDMGDDGTLDTQLDSHFMTGFNAVVADPAEVNSRVFTPAAAKFTFYRGLGQLSVRAGFPSDGLAKDLLLAHLVIPSGQEANLNAAIADGLGSRYNYAQTEITTLPIIPEPVTMLLLAVGAFGVISRRRRA